MLVWAACMLGTREGMTSAPCLPSGIMSWEGISTAGGGLEGSGAIFFPLIIYRTAMFSLTEVDGPGAHKFWFSTALLSDLLPNTARE